MLHLAASLLLSAAAAQPSAEFPKAASPEAAAERVKACGFEHVRPKYDRELEEDVIEVSGVSQVPEAKMRCVVQVSLDTSTFAQFPPSADKHYWRVYLQAEEEQDRLPTAGWMQESARAWLRDRGLMGEVPRYEKGKGDSLAFARRLENVCGPKARGAFVSFHGHVTLRSGPPGKPIMDPDAFQCLVNAMQASGMPFGIVGSETYKKR